eukprot:545444-Pelagomonas_calceolata.AAC.5
MALLFREGAFACSWFTLVATHTVFAVSLFASSDAPIFLLSSLFFAAAGEWLAGRSKNQQMSDSLWPLCPLYIRLASPWWFKLVLGDSRRRLTAL